MTNQTGISSGFTSFFLTLINFLMILTLSQVQNILSITLIITSLIYTGFKLFVEIKNYKNGYR